MKNVNYNKYDNLMQINLNQVVTMKPYQQFTTVDRSKKSPPISQSLFANLRSEGSSRTDPRKTVREPNDSLDYANPLAYYQKKYEQKFPLPQALYPQAVRNENPQWNRSPLPPAPNFHVRCSELSPQNKSQATSTKGSSAEETTEDDENASNFITNMKAKMSALYSQYGPNQN